MYNAKGLKKILSGENLEKEIKKVFLDEILDHTGRSVESIYTTFK